MSKIKSYINPKFICNDFCPLTKDEYKLYRSTDVWTRLKTAAVERAKAACENCDTPGSTDLHHITYVRMGSELPEDVACLCRDCHAVAHEWYVPNDLSLCKELAERMQRIEQLYKKAQLLGRPLRPTLPQNQAKYRYKLYREDQIFKMRCIPAVHQLICFLVKLEAERSGKTIHQPAA